MIFFYIRLAATNIWGPPFRTAATRIRTTSFFLFAGQRIWIQTNEKQSEIRPLVGDGLALHILHKPKFPAVVPTSTPHLYSQDHAMPIAQWVRL
jgi:hypothetical protein